MGAQLMQYLGTNEIGYDRTALGFTSVKTCQAIVYQTAQALIGFHDAFCNDVQFGLKLGHFAQYAQERSIRHKWHARSLIGVINSDQRFKANQVDDWKRQLFAVAAALSFDGEVWGARVTDHLAHDDSMYVRFDVATDEPSGPRHCRVSYKTWNKMEWGATEANNDAMRTFIAYDPAFVARTTDELNTRPYALRTPRDDNRPVHRKGQTGEGNLRPVMTFQRFR